MFPNLETWALDELRAYDNDPFLIPVYDVNAYPFYGDDKRWVYNKLYLSKIQGIKAEPHGVVPDRTPVFSKPIYNLFGLSTGSKIITDPDPMNHYEAGHFWMEFLPGLQYTTDFVMLNGKVIWSYPFLSIKNKQGSFIEFAGAIHLPYHSKIASFLENNLPKHTGVVNVETIEDKIIETHLRMSPQFIDLYGERWLEEVVKLYKHAVWERNFPTNYHAYSLILRVSKDIDGHPSIKDQDKYEKACRRVSSIQLTWNKGLKLSEHTNDGHSHRLAVINAFNRETAQNAINLLSQAIAINDGNATYSPKDWAVGGTFK